MKKIAKIICVLTASALFEPTFAVSSAEQYAVTQVGRYLTVFNKSTIPQVDLLSQIVQVHFPQNIQTVGDAMNYLLQWSGYSLVIEANRSKALKIILAKPLPLIDRELGP